LAGVLLFGVGLVIAGGLRPAAPRVLKIPLEEFFSDAPSGWVKTVRPVAETPELQKAVDKILNYDDAVFVDYVYGTRRVSVYAAYWKPGKMSPRLIASHTPDICWVGAGWKIAGTHVDLDAGLAGNHAIQVAQKRVMRFGAATENVLYWHLLQGDSGQSSVDEGSGFSGLIRDICSRGLAQRSEQLFVRVSSNLAFEKDLMNFSFFRLVEGIEHNGR
jgi:hypothetical protein